MKLFVYYRISDKGNPKEKLPNGDRFSCLRNAIREFGAENIHVIADNCSSATLDFIKSFAEDSGVGVLTIEETSLGNSGSFRYMMEKIINTRRPEDCVYLLEDDYLHLPGSREIILEGLEIADYVTLYDCPDKYLLEKDGGNPFNYKKLQKTRLYLTKSTHWRETNSTTMTFSCRVRTLIDNYKTWKKFTKKRIPGDFLAFVEITQNSMADALIFALRAFTFKKRIMFIAFLLFVNLFRGKKMKKLVSAVPSRATHTETACVAPIIDWNAAG